MDENDSASRFTVRLDPELKDRLDRLGVANDLPTAWFVRRFLREGAERWERGEEGIGRQTEAGGR